MLEGRAGGITRWCVMKGQRKLVWTPAGMRRVRDCGAFLDIKVDAITRD